MGKSNEELKAITCSCGGNLTKSFRSEYDDEEEENVNIPIAKCIACGKEYDQYTQEYYECFADDLTFDKDKSVFKLGLKGIIKGVEYEIIGRIRYQDEDEYEKSTWDEWFAVSSSGSYHYFVEEDGEVHSYEDYIPQSIDMESNANNIIFEGKKIVKSDSYVGRIVFAEGELPWKPEIGEPITCYDFKKDGKKYTIEKSDEEVSITKGEKISYKEIIQAFSSKEYKELYDKTDKTRKDYKRKVALYAVAASIAFCLSFYSCVSTKPVQGVMTGTTVFTDNQSIIENNIQSYFSQVLYGPFDMEYKESLYNIEVSIDNKIQNFNLEWQSFRIMLIKEERLTKVLPNLLDIKAIKNFFTEIDAMPDPVESFVVNGDFWDEEGYDSDGYWHESDMSANTDFILDDAGKYYLYLELYSNKVRKPGSIIVKIEKSKSYRYYILVMLVFFVLMFINYSKAKNYNALPFHVASE